MKLFYVPGTCSLAVHIALRETHRHVELVAIDPVKRTVADGSDFASVSPRGYVPVLEFDDGSRHSETAALLQHIAEQDVSLSLIGAVGSTRRLQVLQWLTFVATELHKPFGWLWQRDTAPATRAAVLAKLERHFGEIDAHLARHDTLAGGFSVADAYAFTVLGWTRVLGMPMDRFPNLLAYLGRVAAWPSVHAAMRAEGLLH